MQRREVSSSNLHSIGYNNITNILEIEFSSGDIYQYSNVPKSIYAGLMLASSHGSYFHKNIKSAKYSYKKIT